MHTTITKLQEELNELDSHMAKKEASETPFVLSIGSVYVSPVIEDHKTTGEVKWHTSPLLATQFCHEDAVVIAKTLRNNLGEVGEVTGRFHAMKDRHDVVIDMMRSISGEGH